MASVCASSTVDGGRSSPGSSPGRAKQKTKLAFAAWTPLNIHHLVVKTKMCWLLKEQDICLV